MPSSCCLSLQEEAALRRGLRLQVELEELLGVPLEDLLNEHQLRCSTLAESGAPLLHLELYHACRVHPLVEVKGFMPCG